MEYTLTLVIHEYEHTINGAILKGESETFQLPVYSEEAATAYVLDWFEGRGLRVCRTENLSHTVVRKSVEGVGVSVVRERRYTVEPQDRKEEAVPEDVEEDLKRRFGALTLTQKHSFIEWAREDLDQLELQITHSALGKLTDDECDVLRRRGIPRLEG